MAGKGLPVQLATRVLGVSESGYYEFRSRGPSAREVRHALLTDLIREVHQASRGTYGYRRVHAELTLGRGLVIAHGTVELLMARAGLAGVTGRPRWKGTRPDLIAKDLVERQFSRDGPNQLWVTDITEHHTREGKLYCAVVLDTFARRVVGWSIDSSPTAALVTNALGMAIDSGATLRHDEHVAALEASVLAAFTDRAPCKRKLRRPPSAAARAQAARLRGDPNHTGRDHTGPGEQVVIDFAPYVAAATDRKRPTTPTTNSTTTDTGAEVTS